MSPIQTVGDPWKSTIVKINSTDASTTNYSTFSGGLLSLASSTVVGNFTTTGNGIFGGTISLFNNTLGRFGVTTTYANADKAGALGADMKVIATGGLAEIIAKETDVLEIIAPWLTLDGLRIIWEINQTLGGMS